MEDYPELGAQVAIGSLPRIFRQSCADFPRHDGYLSADGERRRHWRSRLDALNGKLKVGFGWRGGTRKTRRDLRSLALADCLPLLHRDDCEIVCLQAGDCVAEIAAVRARGGRIQVWPDVTGNIEDLAALISELDLVVTVDSTLAHLSGALGKTVWTLLPASPDWRYRLQGDKMPWYPAMRLFRQTCAGDWYPLLESIGVELARCQRR
jgi:ADP-heptose:LPS heptosyltransferase